MNVEHGFPMKDWTNQNWQQIINESHIAIAILDCEGHIQYANLQAEQVLGLHKESITDRDYNSPAWKSTDLQGNPMTDEQQPFNIVKSTLKPVQNIRHFIENDNHKKLLDIAAFPIFDTDGNLSYVVAQMEDITAKYALIQERDTHFRNYRNLFQNMSNAYAYHRIIYNSEGDPIDYIFLDINEKFTEYTGIHREDAIGKRVTEVIPNFTAQSIKWIKVYGNVAKTGKPYNFEQYDEFFDRTWHINVYSPEPDYFITLFIDISERQRMEQKLRKSETMYRTIFEHSPVGIAINKNDTTIFDLNQNLASMLGYARDFARSKKYIEFYAEDEQRIKAMHELETKEQVINTEILLRRKNGEIFEAFVNSNIVILDDQEYIMTTFQDISKMRQMERDKNLIEEKSRISQKLESLGILAGGIAHDFNNILVGILGNAELAKMDVDPESSIAESIEEIILSTKRAAKLSDQMLLYAGRQNIEKYPVDINQEVTQHQSLLSTIISKNVQLQINLARDVPRFIGDPIQIRQVIMNLVINASDALENREGFIRISTYTKSCSAEFLTNSYLPNNLKPGKYVVLEIQDSGTGISSEIYPKLFEPFFSTKTYGRGLGLSSVLGIVQKHHGTIFVDSIVDHGSTFTVIFPISDIALKLDLPHLNNISSLDLKNRTILLVDDEPSVIKVGSKFLKRLKSQVLTANSGKKALEILDDPTKKINAVIIDMVMPQMDGFTLFQEIRKRDSQIPIFISSGYTEYDISEKFKNRVISGFLHKPYDFHEFQLVLACLNDPSHVL